MTDAQLIVALGSSFAAGPGIDPIVDKAAMRSGANYAHLLAERMGARLVDLSVSGATTATVLAEPQRMLTRRFPPQIEGIPGDADVVTITVGGNDLKFAGSMLAAAMGNRAGARAVTRPFRGAFRKRVAPLYDDAARSAAAAGMTRVATAVKERVPAARVMLVDYLSILGPDTTPAADVPLTDSDIDLFASVQATLQRAFVIAAEQSNVELVSASRLSHDHTLGSTDPWVFGYRGLRTLGSTFHPNGKGMSAIADELYRRIAA